MKFLQYMNLVMCSILIMSTIMEISSTNMCMMWLSLELNMFSFIPLVMNKSCCNEIEASINYLLAQTLGSTMFSFSAFMLISLHVLMKLNSMLMMISVLWKMGAFPCYCWYPMTVEKVSWMNCLIPSTWQKIAPLFIILYIISLKTVLNRMMMLIISSLNAITGGLMWLSQTDLKKVMAYSSITYNSTNIKKNKN